MEIAKIRGEELCSLIAATKGFVSSNDKKEAHQFIKLSFSKENNECKAVAVDGFKLSIEYAPCLSVECDQTVFIKPLYQVKKKETYTVKLTDDGATLVGHSGGWIIPQPKAKWNFDEDKTISDYEKKIAEFKMAFNPAYLGTAITAAIASSGGNIKNPMVIEARSKIEPIFIRTGKKNVKVVLPVWMKEV